MAVGSKWKSNQKPVSNWEKLTVEEARFYCDRSNRVLALSKDNKESHCTAGYQSCIKMYLNYGHGKQHISLGSRGMTVSVFITHYQKHLRLIELILRGLWRRKGTIKTSTTVHSQGAKKLKNIITKPWAAEVVKLSILCSTHTNFLMSIKLNACYSSSFSGHQLHLPPLPCHQKSWVSLCEISSLWNLCSSVYIGRN